MSRRWEMVDNQQGLFQSCYQADLAVSNSYLVQLDYSRWLVYSPGEALLDETLSWLGAGAELIILAPNRVHISGVKAWCQAFNNSRVMASEQTRLRLAKQQNLANVGTVEELAAALPSNLAVHEVPDSKFGEVWVSVREEACTYWMVCDGLMNLKELSPKRLTRWFQRLYGLRLGLWITPIFRSSVPRPGFRHWVEARMPADQRAVLLPCHGEALDSEDTARQVRAMVAQRC
ncbi:hypothetical protein [Saccharospirillum impatiens]|uniref:hypothetical protein n=1 Tax=Saccharospirillum impatiens TaxID=169438 RepID=UPI00048E0166|nr:hypothetical protein [Saccharospirillum impatiens]